MKELAAEQRGDASVFVDVDTYSEAHVAVALDGIGRRIGELRIPNSEAGYAELLGWVLGLGHPVAAGVEGTGSYGSGRVNAAMALPDLLRSWATDVIGLFDPNYVWHDLARTWQTPGEGTESVARLMGAPRSSAPLAWPSAASAGRWPIGWPPSKTRRWTGPSWRGTARPRNRRWPRWAGTSKPRPRPPGRASWPPRTTT